MSASIQSMFSKVDRKAWQRFFFALGGLALAFTAAIYSTVFRDVGDFYATAFLASFALLMAGIVAVTTVPYLARRVVGHRLQHRFQYEFTRVGAIYVVMIFVIGIAALNTGNNLLYIIVSALLAAIAVSGVASAGMLRSLELDVSLPMHVFARRKVLGRFTLHNQRFWAPAFSVSVVSLKRALGKVHRKWQRAIFAWPPGRPPEKQWFRLTDLQWLPVPQSAPPPGIFSGSVYFPYVPRRGSAFADAELNFPRRGAYAQKGLGLSTRFPFSFLVKTLPIAFAREIVVYPAVEQTDEFFQLLPMITGEFEVFVRGRGCNLYLIRDYTPQDSARHLDWKATAKTGALKVREYTREDERKLRIVFDNPPPSTVSEQAYEESVSLTASLAWHFAQIDAELSFAAPGYSGSNDIYEFLAYLAMVQPVANESVLDKLQVTDDYNVIVTARPQGSIPTNLWAASYFVFMQKQ